MRLRRFKSGGTTATPNGQRLQLVKTRALAPQPHGPHHFIPKTSLYRCTVLLSRSLSDLKSGR
jgi:hypothetical protein